MKIQLRKPFFPEESIVRIQKRINQVLHTGQLTLGKNVESFEDNFTRFLGMKYGVAVSSATAGLHVALLSLDIKQGDEVIVPAKTFISTANAASYCNAKPVFCDVDDDTFQIDPAKLANLITKRTKAIIPVHIAGNVCQMDEILEISDKKGIPIVEDAAHAHGATQRKKKAGTFGDIGVFSFYPDKIMASSDGGILVTNNQKIFEKAILYRNVGRPLIGKYDFSVIGYNYRMNEIQAIIAQEQLRLLPLMLKKRRNIAKTYDENFFKLENIQKQKILPEVISAYYAYVLRLDKGNLDNLRNKLSKKGIQTSPMFTTLYKAKPYSKMKIQKCYVSEKLDSQTFSIPLHPNLSETQIDFVSKSLITLVSSNK